MPVDFRYILILQNLIPAVDSSFEGSQPCFSQSASAPFTVHSAVAMGAVWTDPCLSLVPHSSYVLRVFIRPVLY